MPKIGTAGFLASAAPLVFVLLWSTGFIGAKLGLPHVEPFTFLALRFAIVLAILAPVAWLTVRDRPPPAALLHSVVSGVLVHGVYLGGVFFAISRGMPAGVSALVVALQPLATAFFARVMLGERLNAPQIGALAAGLAGVVLVVSPRLAGGTASPGIDAVTLSAAVAAMLAISIGAVYQKRFVANLDLRLSTAAQYAGALVPLAALSFLVETRQIDWAPEFIFALSWLVFVLSIGAVGLLMWLIRNNSASGTASLFYLVPASTAVIAWAMFGESLQPVQLLGMAVVMGAVAVATRAAPK